MIKRTTQTDLMSYAYNDSGLCDSDRIQRAIDGDPLLMEDFKEIIKVIEILDSAKPEISTESMKRILKFC